MPLRWWMDNWVTNCCVVRLVSCLLAIYRSKSLMPSRYLFSLGPFFL